MKVKLLRKLRKGLHIYKKEDTCRYWVIENQYVHSKGHRHFCDALKDYHSIIHERISKIRNEKSNFIKII